MKVQSVYDMSNEEFSKHIDLRHEHLRFTTRGEHEALHRLWAIKSHVHINCRPENTMPDSPAGQALISRTETIAKLERQIRALGAVPVTDKIWAIVDNAHLARVGKKSAGQFSGKRSAR